MAMRRVKGRRVDAELELDQPLLTTEKSPRSKRVPADVEEVVFGKSAKSKKRSSDNIELKTFSTSSNRPAFDNRVRGSPSPTLQDSKFVWHVLEQHHTLAGIALQYRVSTEQLLQLNGLGSHNELHSRDRIKIPAKEHGALLNNPEEYRSAEVGTELFTTAIPKAPSGEDLARKEALIYEPAEPLAEEDPSSQLQSPQSFLSSFDDSMKSAIKAMDETITKTLAEQDSAAPVHIRPSRQKESWEFTIKDWRLALIAVCAVFLVSFSTYFLYHMVRADNGTAHGSTHNGQPH